MAKAKQFSENVKREYDALKKTYDSLSMQVADVESTREKLIEDALRDYHVRLLRILTERDKLKRKMDTLLPKRTIRYKKDWGYKEKILWVLEDNQKMMPATPIAREIKKLDEAADMDEINKRTRLIIGRMVDKNEIVKHKIQDVSGFHYGLPEWFVNGIPIEGYLV